MKFHDAHCHLASKSFQKDFELDKSMILWEEMGLDYVIGVSTKFSESEAVLELTKKYDKIIPGIGVHPWSAKKTPSEELMDKFQQLFVTNNQIVIGEIGLDHHFIKDEERYPFQEQYFRFFLQIAEKRKLPINLHLKGAEELASSILTSYSIPSNKVLIHWYSGPASIRKEFMNRGYFFTINPSILSGSTHIDVIKEVPINQVLTESDGNTKYTIDNERVIGCPSLIPRVINEISDIIRIDKEEVSVILKSNLRNYLNIG